MPPSKYAPSTIHAELENAAKGSWFEQKVRLQFCLFSTCFSFLFFPHAFSLFF